MTEQALENRGNNGGSPGSQFLSTQEVIARLGNVAQAEAIAGIVISWGAALDWPAWMYEGTSLDPSRPVPSKISLADDLIIVSHFLDRFGPKILLETALTSISAEFDINNLQIYKSAPNTISFLKYITRAVNITNPIHRLSIYRVTGGIELKFISLVDVGRIAIFIEHLGIIMIMRALSLFSPLLQRIELGRGFVPKLMLRQAPDDVVETVARLGMLDVETSDQQTSIFVPQSLLRRSNPAYDPETWRGLFAQLNADWSDGSSRFSISSLRLEVNRALRHARRVPTLDDFASDMSISKRTIGRKLASRGISYRGLVREERMKLARQMLTDRNKSVREIAHQLGYGNVATFSRAFRQQLGISPTVWRDRY